MFPMPGRGSMRSSHVVRAMEPQKPEPVGLTVPRQWAVRIRERAMTDPRVAERARAAGAHEAAQTVKGFCEAMPAPERAEDFGAFFDRFADAKVVLLGEATHGTSEFYRARAAITRRLIERHGSTLVAVEAAWPDAARIDAYVRHHAPQSVEEDAFVRFPAWMWKNAEVRDFADWMRVRNEALPPDRRAGVRGLPALQLHRPHHAPLGQPH